MKNKTKMNVAYKFSRIFLGLSVLLILCAVALYILSLLNILDGFDKIIKAASISACVSAVIGVILTFFSKPKKKNEMVILTMKDEKKD